MVNFPEPLRVKDSCLREIVEKAWDIEAVKRVYQENNLDVDRLPLGRLTKD
jgi:hypothetical protein